jgi:hypothetical protein
MSPSLEVLVKPDGQLTIETHGIPGNPCRQASLFLEQALGQTTVEMLTAEFYLAPPLCQHERQQAQ